jgi:type IV pilus assembly protein PilQ
MKFKRLLTVGFMALFCAGTATAASQLNSVQVTPAANSATVNLRTTGSFAHKEYRPDEHMVLVDLTGVTADFTVERTAALSSAVLKGYKLSSYTSASGSEVTRIELTLGDGVGIEVNDKNDGLQIVLRGGGTTAATRSSVSSVASSFPSVSSSETVAAPKSVVTDTFAPGAATAPQSSSTVNAVKPSRSVSENALPVAKNGPTEQGVQVSPARPVDLHPRSAEPGAGSALNPIVIRSISVQHGHGTLDIVIEGPNAANPFLLKDPDRVVLDFKNAVVRPTVRNIAVHTKDVAEVRVGRFQAEPPITRIVIDLKGPRTFDVVASANQVTVRVKTEEVVKLAPPLKAPQTPVRASVEAPAVVGRTNVADLQNNPHAASAIASVDHQPEAVVPPTGNSNSSLQDNTHAALASALVKPQSEDAVLPAVKSSSSLPEQPVHDPELRVGSAAETIATPPQTQSAPEVARANPPAPPPPAPAPTQASSNAIVSPIASPKYTGEPISVNLKDVDLKDFFRLIHEISGLNIVLDPSVKGTVTLVLDDVPWDQALDIVLKNNALDRELQGNVLRIAATDTLRREAVDRRAQSEAVALAVDRQTISRFLSYAKAKEVVPTIKKFLTARGDVISDDRTNSLIISDIPSVLPSLDRLISQLDKKSQEVEIEVRVVSATRSFSRDLGFQLGFNWGNGVSTIGGSNPNGVTNTATTGGGTSTSAGTGVPLFTNLPATGATTGFSLSNITANYGIDAILTAAETHNLAKVLSRPRVVTQSNVKAEVKQGVKLPVYTAGTGNANASVSYVDAVLRLSVTPQITSDNTIFLTVDVENTQPSGTINQNYILTTQQATTQVLVTDGGTVVIGGVIQTSNSVSTTQTPLLGNIPWLGNLFKERFVKTETDELIFFITPKIIQT